MTNIIPKSIYKELIKAQILLDAEIRKKSGVDFNNETVRQQRKYALISEWQEAVNATGVHKYWKESRYSQEAKRRVTEEVVDILHFILSHIGWDLNLEQQMDVYGLAADRVVWFTEDEPIEGIDWFEQVALMTLDKSLSVEMHLAMLHIFMLEHHISVDEVVRGYEDKNQINKERLTNGY